MYKRQQLYNLELASLYFKKGNKEKYVDKLLSVLILKPDEKEEIQNQLQKEARGKDKEIIERAIYAHIQKYNHLKIFPELLLWYYLENRDYESALIQSKALDKRTVKSINKFASYAIKWNYTVSVAKHARDLKNYNQAIDIYKYVLTKSKESNNKFNEILFRMDIADCKNELVESTYPIDTNVCLLYTSPSPRDA